MKTRKGIHAALFCAVLASAGCAAAQPSPEVARDLKCSATRALYDRAQDELIGRGLCDPFPTVAECPAHVALREAFIVSLHEQGCGS